MRPDYIERAPWLRQFAARSATGALRECFGFVPRAAYFGGLNAAAYGFTNMYCFDPERSPFGMAAALPASPAGAVVEAREARIQAIADLELQMASHEAECSERSSVGSRHLPVES